jgi:hypothetical protein
MRFAPVRGFCPTTLHTWVAWHSVHDMHNTGGWTLSASSRAKGELACRTCQHLDAVVAVVEHAHEVPGEGVGLRVHGLVPGSAHYLLCPQQPHCRWHQEESHSHQHSIVSLCELKLVSWPRPRLCTLSPSLAAAPLPGRRGPQSQTSAQASLPLEPRKACSQQMTDSGCTQEGCQAVQAQLHQSPTADDWCG